MNVLEVSDLAVATGGGRPLLSGVTFTVAPGERVGLIGESGSGKSMTVLAAMGLLPPGVRATGSVRLHDGDSATEVIGASERRLCRLRGRRASMVFQEPMSALDPTMRIGDQIAEVMLVHRTRPDRRTALARAEELLEQVQLPDPRGVLGAYPHQLSGGQRQRVVLAIALANDPELLICDEPTTALDVTVQARVLDLIVSGVEARQAAMLFITHDLAVVSQVCERVLVMVSGRIVEAGSVEQVFTDPRHAYTRGLLAASDLTTTDAAGRLRTMPADAIPPGGPGRPAPPWHGTAENGYAVEVPVPANDAGLADDVDRAEGAS